MVTARKILLFLAAAQVLLGCGREVRPAAAVSGTQLRLLVGTYTEGTSAEGVYLYSYDPATPPPAPLPPPAAALKSAPPCACGSFSTYGSIKYGAERPRRLLLRT
jgi:hypothetical protein